MASYGQLWRIRFQAMRPGNAAMAAVAVAIGVRLAGPLPPLHVTLAAALAAFLITAFGNVLNDIVDRDIDKLAHPERPLPSGRISVTDAKRFAGLLVGLGLIEAWFAGGTPLLLFAAINVLVLVAYELRLKRWPLIGNLIVGALVASTLAFGALANGAWPWPTLWLMMAMMALTNAAREVLKDMQDMHADQDRKTWPMLVGTSAASWTATALIGIAVGLAVALALRAPAWSQFVLGAAAIGFVVDADIACWGAANGQKALKATMAVALVGFALLAIGR